jgi:hypothetical protein
MDELVEVGESLCELGPGIGDEREEEPGATGGEQAVAGLVELFRGEMVLLEVDAGEAVDLEVEEGWGDEGEEIGLVGVMRQCLCDDAVVVVDLDGGAGLKVATNDGCFWGFHGGRVVFERQHVNFGKGGGRRVGFARPLPGVVVVWRLYY